MIGTADRDRIDAWLVEQLRRRRSAEVSAVLLRSGRVAAVYGLELDDSHRVAVEVHRSPADLSYLAAATSACAGDDLARRPGRLLPGRPRRRRSVLRAQNQGLSRARPRRPRNQR